MYLLFGIVSIVFGLVVALSPVHHPFAMAWLIGIGAGVYGGSCWWRPPAG
jgi:uncharacterized membrane protein HdeD (DUF308 family)